MRFAFILIAFVVTHNGFTQGQRLQLSNKAFDFYHKQGKIDSALVYFLRLNQLPGKNPVPLHFIIGDCYKKLGDPGNAEKFYLQCLSMNDSLEISGNLKANVSDALSDLYVDGGQYRQALQYLEFTRTKYKPRHRECPGFNGYGNELHFAYKKSICYAGLGQKDSAIQVLAPMIFRPRSYGRVDSAESEKMTRFFVNLVVEVYGAEQAKYELQQAIKRLGYNASFATYKSMGGSDVIMCSVDCAISFANTKIRLDHLGQQQVHRKGVIPEAYSKEVLLGEFTSSLAYQYIMKCESAPVTRASLYSFTGTHY